MRHRSLALLSLLGLLLAHDVPAQTINKCQAGKKKCLAQKVKGLLGCHVTAEAKGQPVLQSCVDKVTAKFSHPADGKGCMEKIGGIKPPRARSILSPGKSRTCNRPRRWRNVRTEDPGIPLFIDIHDVTGATLEQLADAHLKDLAVQGDFGVSYHKYWLNEGGGKVFCLCTAPNAEAAEQVHRHAHGLVAERIIEVDPDLAEGMLGGGRVARTGAVVLDADGTLDPGMRTILFTDIVGSTELTQRLGDRAALDVVDLHDRLVRDALGRTRGREVKHLGDGLMGVFVAADDAIRCASDVHAALRDAAGRTVEQVRVRVGVATGEPIERKGDFFGSTVQLAARLCVHAEPGQTLVSSSVVELCGSRRFSDLGEITLKGFAQPVRAHAVVEA